MEQKKVDKPKKVRTKRSLSTKLTPYAYTMPAIILFLVFTVYPMINMIRLSFYEWNGLTEEKFVGLQNYNYLFNLQVDFKIALQNTLVYTVSVVFFLLLFALIFAVWLQKDSKINAMVQRLMFFPHLCSMLAISTVFSWLMDEEGLFNAVLSFFDLPGLRWLNDSTTAMMSIVIIAVWKGMGYHALILLSSLKSIPTEIYEAAALDNTPPVRKFFRITIPLLSPQLFFMLINITLSSFKVFESIRVLTKGGPGKSTIVLVYYIYEYAQSNLKYGVAAAAGVVLLIFLAILTVIYFRLINRRVHYQ
ncbi:MAG: sugar ABC transporter permease [Tyzzerella sp.]|nr:sugar ABC transporter permease [Tyzzerella sp.]